MGSFELFFKRILASVIVFQIGFAPLAFADDKSAVPAGTSELTPSERQDLDGLFANLTGGNKHNPLDTWDLLRQDFIESNAKKVKSISPSSVLFNIQGADFHSLKQFKASESLYGNFNGIVPAGSENFQILMEGALVHRFRVPIEAIGVLGNYIVFIEKNSYNAQENIRHISFLDLDYFRLAKGEIPVARLPIHGTETVNSFRIEKNILYINDRPFEQGLFDFIAPMQRTLFNMAANTTEPGHLMRVLQTAEPFVDAFNANLVEAGKQANTETFKKDLEFAVTKQIEQLKKMNATASGMTEEQIKAVAETFEAPLQQTMSKVRDNVKKQRSLIGATSLLWQQMTIPRPAEVGKLKEKIVTVAVGFKRNRVSASDMYELATGIASNRMVHLSLGTLAAVGAAYFFPEQSLYALKSTLGMIETISAAAFGKVGDLADLAYTTTTNTFSGLNPLKVYETYVADGAWKRTSVGVSAMFSILGLVVGIPHVIVNTYYLVKDFRGSPSMEWGSSEGKRGISEFAKRIVPNFVRRQQDLHRAYLQALSDDRQKKSVTAQDLSLDEITQQARELVARMEAQTQSNLTLKDFALKTKIWGAIGLFTEVNLPAVANAGKWANGQWKKFKNIENFAGALSHFLFSFAAFTKSGVFYATTWNYFYILRILILSPKLAMTFMLYPNFFRRAIATELGKVTPPSFWNGGNRWLWQEVSLKLNSISQKDQYIALKNFENSVVEVEKQIGQEALPRAMKALTRYLEYDMNKVVKLSERPGMTKKLSSKDIGDLAYDARAFFSSYYESIVENSMRQYLAVQASTESVEIPGLSKEQIKNWFVDNKKQIVTGLVDPKKLVESQATEEAYNKAYAIVHESKRFLTKVNVTATHSAIRGLDAETNGKIRRFVIAEQQMKKASAMARAVRANIVSLLVDKPLELALLFVLTAGITDGPNKPLFDQMFSNDAAFYLSRNVYMGYVAGLLISIFADVWVKIQQDTRVDKLGGFEQVPEGDHAKKGFWSWYRYQFAHNKNNKWWDHHKYFSEIIYHNMGPAFILMTITGMATLGRVDLDFYFVGYIIAFGLPFSGLSVKLEQTFEIATGWVMKDIPEALRNHPLVLEWANKRITKLRVGFQIFYKLYENITAQFFSNLMAVTTARNGTRALSRILFGGRTLTEHLIEKTTAAANAVPAAKLLDNACRFFFTNNYSSGPLPPRPQ